MCIELIKDLYRMLDWSVADLLVLFNNLHSGYELSVVDAYSGGENQYLRK